MAEKNEYFPYGCREDAKEEYLSLRNEVLESQKHRNTLFAAFLGGIGALFSYLIGDNIFTLQEATVLIILTLPPSLFTYSTRLRERRIASFLSVFTPLISPWSRASSRTSKVKFKPLQRTSLSMILTMIILDFILIYFALTNDRSMDWVLIIISICFLGLNCYLFFATKSLKDFQKGFEELLITMKEADENKLKL